MNGKHRKSRGLWEHLNAKGGCIEWLGENAVRRPSEERSGERRRGITPKSVLLVFALSLLAFIPYFLRETVYGGDSYYWKGLVLPSAPVLLIAGICFILFLISNLILSRFPGSSWFAVFLAASSPLWLMSWYKFENDLFAMPFVLLACYFFLKKQDWLCLVCLVPAGLLFNGAVVLPMAFSISNPLFLVAWLPVAIVFWKSFVALGPLFGVAESWPIVHFIYLGVLGWPFIVLMGQLIKTKRWPETRLVSACLVLTVFGLANGRWFVFAIPFLAVWMGRYIPLLRFRWKALALYVSLCLFLAMLPILHSAPPTKADLGLIREAGFLSWAEGRPLKNTWSVGYWVEHELPGRATAWGGGEGWDKNYAGAFVLAGAQEAIDCPLITKEQNVAFYQC